MVWVCAVARAKNATLGLFVAATLALAAARDARANGRFPASNAVVFDPREPSTVYVRATFGVLVTRDAGESWRWICERAVGFSGVEDPTYVVTPKGTIVAGTFEGAAVSRDGGCDWSFAGGPSAHVFVDVAMRPDGEIVGLSSSYDRAGDGGSLYKNGVYVSKDDAVSFTSTGASFDPTLLMETIEVAPSDAGRVYLSAVRGEGAERTAAFLVSVDGGASFVERSFKLSPGELAPYIAAVDPTRPDRVYVRTGGGVDTRSRLVVTDDAGKTWRTAFEAAGPLPGFALDAMGSRVFAGGRESGVVSAAERDLSFTKVASLEVGCLGASGGALWACATERSGFFVGLSKDGGKRFDAKLHLDGIKGPLECAAGSRVATECAKEWPKLLRELGLDPSGESKGPRPSGPAMKGRGERTRRGSTGSGIAIAAVLIGGMLYYVIKRLRR